MKLLNHLIIRPDSVFNEEVNGMEMPNAWYVEREGERYLRKNLRGTIVSEPMMWTDQNFMPIDEGMPRPMCFVGHDIIQEKVNRGYEWDNRYYNGATVEQLNWLTYADYGARIDAKEGEICYFHPGVTEKDNSLGNGLYKVSADNLICVIRDGVPVPQGFWVLVDPMYTGEVKVGDIVASESEMILQQGTVRYGAEVGFVYFQENSEWKVTIEGHEYLVMLQENLLMKK